MTARITSSQLSVYSIVDPRESPMTARELAEAIYGAGVPVVQLRAKGATDDELRIWSADFVDVAANRDALFIVNDRVDLALEVGADGVHLGPHDMSIGAARELAPDFIIGGSAGTVERAVELQNAGADYLGCGAVWDAAPSKDDASAPRGLEMIREVSSAVNIPIVGIGGISRDRAPEVVEAGAAGVAVIRAILAQPDPGAAAADLVDLLTR